MEIKKIVAKILGKKGSVEQPLLCKTSSKMVSRLKEKYPDITEFCKACTPNAQNRYLEYPLTAFTRNTATMTDLNIAFGEGSGAAWLVPQLTNLSEFCGCKNKLTPEQLKEVAIILSKRYGYIKTSEFLLFFALMKSGKYGKFYGSLDPMVITSSFLDFLDDRACKYVEIDNIIAEQKRAEEAKKPHYTRDEWEQLKRNREA